MKINKELAALRIENAELEQKLRAEIEYQLNNEKKIMNDPAYWASGVYCFATPCLDRYFNVEIVRGDVRLIEKHKDGDIIFQQVSPSRL